MNKKEVIEALKAINVEDESLSILNAHDKIVDLMWDYVETLPEEVVLSSEFLSEIDRDFWPPDEVCGFLWSILMGNYGDEQGQEMLDHVVDAVSSLVDEEEPVSLYFMSPYEDYFRPVVRQDIIDQKNNFIKFLEELTCE